MNIYNIIGFITIVITFCILSYLFLDSLELETIVSNLYHNKILINTEDLHYKLYISMS
jgi:hypothetical protein